MTLLGKSKEKGMVKLSNDKGKSQDVLFVDGLKHNILSASQVCDRGCEVFFTSKYCKTKYVPSGLLVEKRDKNRKQCLCLERRKRRMSSKKV